MPGALQGIRVLDMTLWQQGTSASAMLADLGADVIKIEECSVGDPGRGFHVIEAVGLSAYFQALNRGKRSIALNLKTEAGRSVFFRLTETADVFITNYRPGVTESLGIGYKETARANPAIVYARASGYGRNGPDAQNGSFDILGQARGGLMAVTGDPDRTPKNTGAPIADQVGGMMAAFGVLAALLYRERTGEGQEIDVSLLGSVMALQSFNITSYLFSGELPERFPRAGRTPFWNVYQGSDGKWFAIGMLLNRGWSDICELIGRNDLEDDERFSSYRGRVRDHAAELIEVLDAEFAAKPAAEWVSKLCELGMYSVLVQDYEDICRDPQVLANGYIEDVPRPDGDPVKMVTTPVQMSRSPARIQGLAPEHGQHTEAILLEAGYTWDEIEALRADGAIGANHDAEEAES